MDSNPPLPQPLKPTASKLPIKRKNPDPHHNPTTTFLAPPPTAIGTADSVDSLSTHPPFKFHRIWTEPDEIRFLKGLLNSSSQGQGLSFPRDLPFFYDQFLASMPQPYTKSQLSEKLRRLRKKFRTTSSRISRGLDVSLLSAHDRSLYHLSKHLWSPQHSATSPFGSNDNGRNKTDSCDGNCNVDLDFTAVDDYITNDVDCLVNVSDNGVDVKTSEQVKISEVNLGYDFGEDRGSVGGLAANSVLNVFDECFKEARRAIVKKSGGLYFTHTDSVSTQLSKNKDFQTRLRELKVAEFDLFACRLRLVLDNSLRSQSVCK